MKRHFVFLCLLLLFSGGCAGRDAALPSLADLAASPEVDARAAAEDMLRKDPAGPLPSPSIPPELRGASSSGSTESAEGEPIPYSIECLAPEAPELVGAFEKASLLYQLEDTPPTSMTGLTQRLDASLATGKEVLQSFGFYAGTVDGEITGGRGYPEKGTQSAPQEAPATAGTEAAVKVVFTPGPRYQMGKTTVRPTAAVHPASLSADSEEQGKRTRSRGPRDRIRPLPTSLEDVGLARGAPAIAADVLAAVERVRDAYRNRGYPAATIAGTRYIVDHQTKLLEAEVRVAPGTFTRMGQVAPTGEVTVRQRYLDNMRTWTPGVPWNQERVEAFRNALRESGLFRSIDLAPAPAAGKDEDGETRDLVTTLLSAPERTLSGAVKYDSDFGPGIQGAWEHRNLTGRGDALRLAMPLWVDMQELSGTYRLPFFLRRDQTFLARGGVLHENTDAYELQSMGFASGVERRFSRRWSGSLMGSAEGGNIKDPEEPRRDYLMLGLPAMLVYDSTNSPLDAVRGMRFLFSAAPYTGTYNDDFDILRTRTDLQAFLPLAGPDTLVLALRGVLGGLWGTMAPNVPPTVRFYSGGGGSVRGYEYQSLGPRNSDDDPLGGTGLVEMSVEPRLKLTEEWGLVAFLDGGMAYEKVDSQFGKDLRFGAGGGIRYYTPIGPVRFDVATPLNARDSDESVQFYISIGQSF